MAEKLNAAGKRLLASLEAQDQTLCEQDNPMREVALRAAATADRVAHLGELSTKVDAIMQGRAGETVHPIFAELRQQESHLARLLTALRLPDEATGKRPQRRQMRGAQKPSQVGASSRDRLHAVPS